MPKIFSLRRHGATRWVHALYWATLFFFCSSLHALEVEDLYRVSVPVESEDAVERKRAVREAFGKVLVKITGNRQVISRQSLRSDFEDAARYVQQYRYRLRPTQEAEAANERLLQVTFDPAEMERLLQRRSLPLWSSNRPGILVWLGVDELGSKRRLLNPETDLPVYTALAETGDVRGLPLLFPLMDLEDQSQMQVADLWGDFESNIRAASLRYGPDLILTGRISQLEQSAWRGEWRVYSADKQSSWSNQAGSEQVLVADALQRFGDQLAARYAPLRRDRDLSTVRLQVAGVHSLQDYARMLELLSRQESLERVVVVAVSADTVTYDLHGQGGQSALESGLGIGGALVPDLQMDRDSGDLTDLVDLYYRLR